MSNLLNEEIRAINLYMSHLERAIPLEVDSGKKQKMRNNLKDLEKILTQKLEQCEDYKG